MKTEMKTETEMKKNRSSISQIIDTIRENSSFCIVSHFLPDGDSIGSAVAMALSLTGSGKQVSVYCRDAVPAKYRFLSGTGLIKDKFTGNREDVLLVLDCSHFSRTGLPEDLLLSGQRVINIDHHVTNSCFGEINLVDSSASATGEIIFDIITRGGFPLDQDIATSLYVAILTDTGSFKYENTTAATHAITAALMEFGINPSIISQRLFDDQPVAYLTVLKNAISSLELWAGGRIASFTVSREMIHQAGATMEIMDGIVNYTKNIDTVEIGILFFIENNKEVKVGLRSKNVDVSILARHFNGGGHMRAAGFRAGNTYTQIKEKTIKEAVNLLKDSKQGDD